MDNFSASSIKLLYTCIVIIASQKPPKSSGTGLTKLHITAIVPERCKMAYCALVAQLAEHIHGKDKVISSILIEG